MMLEIDLIVRWTVLISLMVAFVVRFYRLPKSPDKLENFIAVFPIVFLGSFALAYGIHLILLVLFPKEMGKLLTSFDRIYIVAGIVSLVLNASRGVLKYFFLPGEVEIDEPKPDTDESDGS
ncbi:MAG: hypothetical protein SXA11_24940 [Cyanobacteriota bacterium]|nr:hypothetical protein [Cyanobacteriota bacterium]